VLHERGARFERDLEDVGGAPVARERWTLDALRRRVQEARPEDAR